MFTKKALAALTLTTALMSSIGSAEAAAFGPEDRCWNGCTHPADPNNPPRHDPNNIDPNGRIPREQLDWDQPGHSPAQQH